MKKIAVALALVFTLAGCSSAERSSGRSNTNKETSERFIQVYYDIVDSIYVDSRTNVMYYWHSSGNSGGLTIMVDENGQPLLWKGE